MISVTADLCREGELESQVDKDIEEFAAFFQKTLNNSGLSRFERAIIKTYLAYKLKPATPKTTAQ
jgi:hypothetical protein